MRNSIILGLGFGDEGKGLITSYLCSKSNKPIVIRFSGGHQAGHTVIYNDRRHVFSNFGSGTLQGVPTFWSKYCTFSPESFLNEYKLLNDLSPKVYVDPLCPVTTPFDKHYNEHRESINNHGSCKVGFGSTIQRNEDCYKLFVQDLPFPSVYKAKLKLIQQYYKSKFNYVSTAKNELYDEMYEQFCKNVEKVVHFIQIHNPLKRHIALYDHQIFEGSQGILLDMDFGFFPNVTRSNTTSKNAIKLARGEGIEVYYVSRSYQTRHGNGFMTNEHLDPPVLDNITSETNIDNEFQGKFRKTILDFDLLNYALTCDNNFSRSFDKNLVITCLDQTTTKTRFTVKGKEYLGDILEGTTNLNSHFNRAYASFSPSSNDMAFFSMSSKLIK